MTARMLAPTYHKWQLRPWYKNVGPVFRYMNKMTINFYPYSPNNKAAHELYRRVNTRQQLLHTEKNFSIEMNEVPFGERAHVLIEYRNGDVMKLCAESHTAEEILKMLMMKRLDMEHQLEWVEVNTMLTLEEEAMLMGADKDSKKRKVPATLGKGPAKPAAAKKK